MVNEEKGFLDAQSTGFPDQHQRWWFDVVKDRWISTRQDSGNRKRNPDFFWRPEPTEDYMLEASWPLTSSKDMNPFFNEQISPRDIYQLYIRSIATDDPPVQTE